MFYKFQLMQAPLVSIQGVTSNEAKNKINTWAWSMCCQCSGTYYDRFLELDKQNLLNQKFWIIKKRNPHQVVILKKKNSLCKHDSALLKLEAQKTAGNRNRGIEQVRFFLLVLLFCVPWAITRIMVFSLKSSIRTFFIVQIFQSL
jgi:hypothetical protein